VEVRRKERKKKEAYANGPEKKTRDSKNEHKLKNCTNSFRFQLRGKKQRQLGGLPNQNEETKKARKPKKEKKRKGTPNNVRAFKKGFSCKRKNCGNQLPQAAQKTQGEKGGQGKGRAWERKEGKTKSGTQSHKTYYAPEKIKPRFNPGPNNRERKGKEGQRGRPSE